LHLLLRLHLLHHGSAAAGDLPDPNLERKRAVLREIGRRRTRSEGEPRRYCEAVLAAFLHLGHGLRESGEDLLHREGLRAAVALAAVEHGTVVGGQDIIEECGVGPGDRLTLAGLERTELETTRRHFGTERSGADPRQANTGSDDQQKCEPQSDRPAALGGAMGGFGDGHGLFGVG